MSDWLIYTFNKLPKLKKNVFRQHLCIFITFVQLSKAVVSFFFVSLDFFRITSVFQLIALFDFNYRDKLNG